MLGLEGETEKSTTEIQEIRKCNEQLYFKNVLEKRMKRQVRLGGNLCKIHV